MANRSPRYRRLPGRGIGVAQYSRLYEGPDHFLLVSSTGFTENYKRFYFRDIQGFVVERNFWHLLWSVLWVGLIAMFGVPAMLSDGTGFVVLSSIAGFFLLLLLLNLAMGPSCVCTIQTAVQTEKLPTLKRTRAARKFIRRVQPVLTRAQTEAGEAHRAATVESEAAAPVPESTGPETPAGPAVETT